MISKEEVIKLVNSKYPGRYIEKVTENDKYFLISLVRRKSDDPEFTIINGCDDGLKAVDKNTKEIFTYNPLRHKYYR